MTFKSSVSHAVIMSLLSLSLAACDSGGGSNDSSGITTPSPPPPPAADTSGPTLTISPTSLSLTSGQSSAVTITANDSGGVASGPAVSCTNGGTFANGVFTAPTVTTATTTICTVSATDTAGNVSNQDFTVSLAPAPPPDTTVPVLSFNPATLSVISGGTGNSVLNASDNVAITSGPSVTCSNNGSFADGVFTAPSTPTASSSLCTALAQDAAGNEGTATLTVNIAAAPAAQTLSGTATYDFVPHIGDQNGSRIFGTALDFDSIEQRPIRGAMVELVNASNVVLETATTNALGAYSFEVDPNVNVRVRVRAQLLQTTGAQWDVRVQDNTSGDAIYALQTSLQDTGTASATRDLNADSGWGVTSYTGPRQAAPFAIMDQIYGAVTLIAAHDPDVVFPLARLNWSVNNRPVSGDPSIGEITTSSYVGNGNMFILGDESNDTDEFDTHIIVHEWGHYFEDQLSRSDSIGGPHGSRDRLDPRVAMGEGFGNALSGMITGDPIYRDSSPSLPSSFAFNVEDNEVPEEGWFNETSVQSILYDLFDAESDAGDTLSLGIGPVYDVFVSDSYKETPYFTTIFAYLDEFRSQFPANVSGINTLAADRNVNGTGPDGAGETSNGTVASALPLYNNLNVNGGPVEVCSVDDQGTQNKLGNNAYVIFNVTSPGFHTFTMTRNPATSTATSRNPAFVIFRNEAEVGFANRGGTDTEQVRVDLSAGLHRIDAFDFLNAVGTFRGDACYNFTVTR